MRQQNQSFAILISFVILALGAALAYARLRVGDKVEAVAVGAGAVVLSLIVSSTIQVADQWDRAVILRLGHFHAIKGSGLFFIIPVLDAIPYWIDTRVITTGFKAETMGLGQEHANGGKMAEPKKQPSLETPSAREIINGIEA